jgi:hypothetical protein
MHAPHETEIDPIRRACKVTYGVLSSKHLKNCSKLETFVGVAATMLRRVGAAARAPLPRIQSGDDELGTGIPRLCGTELGYCWLGCSDYVAIGFRFNFQT